MKYKKIKLVISIVILTVFVIVAGLYCNIIRLPYFGHVIHVDYIRGLNNDRMRVGMSDFVFVGKVINKQGYKKHSVIAPFTIYSVEIIDNIKGDLDGKITMAQMGGYYFGVSYQIEDSAEIQPGKTYLLATRYDDKENLYVVDTHQSGSKLISEDKNLSSEELKALARADEKFNAWQEAYKNEIIPEADIKNGRVYNSYQLLLDQKQDNTIYYSSDLEYPLVLNQTAYPANEDPEISKKLSEDNLNELSLMPVMTVPENSWIFNIGSATGTDDIYFVVNSTLNYWYTAHQNSPILENPAGGGVTILSVYKYEPITATITKLFDTTDIAELVRKFPAIKSISADSRYIAFNIHGCWGCGAGHPDTFLYDKEKQTGQNIGRVFDFEWLNNGDYQYKKYIEIPCENPFGCHEDPAELPIISGMLN